MRFCQLLISFILFLPSGCAVTVNRHAPVIFNYNEQRLELELEQPATSAVQVVPKPPKPDQACRFLLPEARALPEMQNLKDEAVVTSEDAAMVLALHVRDLRGYIDDERRRVEQAYRAYLKRCGL
jgi:hypothetical protein